MKLIEYYQEGNTRKVNKHSHSISICAPICGRAFHQLVLDSNDFEKLLSMPAESLKEYLSHIYTRSLGFSETSSGKIPPKY